MTIFCMFPGQASQFVGMGKDLYTEFPLVKSFFDRASSRLGFDLAELCFEDPKSQLALTQFTQPALLTLSTAVWFLHLEKNEIKDVIFAGHSLGEYSALVAAEVISFEEAVSLVHKRGQLMQEAVAPGEGGMSALLFKKGTAGAVESQAICREVSEKSQSCLVPANYNSPEQVVVSGTKVALGFLSENYKNYSCIRKVVPLEVSAPFHSPLMHDASQIFKKHLEDCAFNFSGRFSESSFIPNVNGEISQFKNWSKETMVDSLVRQFASSVLWQQSVEKAIEAGASSANEFGAGKVLSGLLRRINFNQKQIDGCQFGEVGDFK